MLAARTLYKAQSFAQQPKEPGRSYDHHGIAPRRLLQRLRSANRRRRSAVCSSPLDGRARHVGRRPPAAPPRTPPGAPRSHARGHSSCLDVLPTIRRTARAWSVLPDRRAPRHSGHHPGIRLLQQPAYVAVRMQRALDSTGLGRAGASRSRDSSQGRLALAAVTRTTLRAAAQPLGTSIRFAPLRSSGGKSPLSRWVAA